MSEWKELKIENIPSDFFVNGGYEVETVTSEGTEEYNYNLESRYLLINDLRYNKFQYRLKPLESMKVTQETMNDLLFLDSASKFPKRDIVKKDGVVVMYQGRKVEIIGEK